MPCRSDYMEPNGEEEYVQHVAKLIVYVDLKLGEVTGQTITDASDSIYGDGLKPDLVVPMLCAKIKNMSKKQLNNIVYNAKDSDSRKLADWWEEHQKVDKNREKEEKEHKKQEIIRKQALSKLSKEEKKALNL